MEKENNFLEESEGKYTRIDASKVRNQMKTFFDDKDIYTYTIRKAFRTLSYEIYKWQKDSIKTKINPRYLYDIWRGVDAEENKQKRIIDLITNFLDEYEKTRESKSSLDEEELYSLISSLSENMDAQIYANFEELYERALSIVNSTSDELHRLQLNYLYADFLFHKKHDFKNARNLLNECINILPKYDLKLATFAKYALCGVEMEFDNWAIVEIYTKEILEEGILSKDQYLTAGAYSLYAMIDVNFANIDSALSNIEKGLAHIHILMSSGNTEKIETSLSLYLILVVSKAGLLSEKSLFNESKNLLEYARTEFIRLGKVGRVVEILFALAQIEIQENGFYSDWAHYIEEAQEYAILKGSFIELATSYGTLALTISIFDPNYALKTFKENYDFFLEKGDDFATFEFLVYYSRFCIHQNDYLKAEELLSKQLLIAKNTDDIDKENEVYINFVSLENRRNDKLKQQYYSDLVLESLKKQYYEAHSTLRKSSILEKIIEVHNLNRNFKSSLENAYLLLGIYENLQLSSFIIESMLLVAEYEMKSGNPVIAYEKWLEVIELTKPANLYNERALAHLECCKYLLDLFAYDDALEHFENLRRLKEDHKLQIKTDELELRMEGDKYFKQRQPVQYDEVVKLLYNSLKTQKEISNQIIRYWYYVNLNDLIAHFQNMVGLKAGIFSEDIEEIKSFNEHFNWLFDFKLIFAKKPDEIEEEEPFELPFESDIFDTKTQLSTDNIQITEERLAVIDKRTQKELQFYYIVRLPSEDKAYVFGTKYQLPFITYQLLTNTTFEEFLAKKYFVFPYETEPGLEPYADFIFSELLRFWPIYLKEPNFTDKRINILRQITVKIPTMNESDYRVRFDIKKNFAKLLKINQATIDPILNDIKLELDALSISKSIFYKMTLSIVKIKMLDGYAFQPVFIFYVPSKNSE